MTFPFSSTDSLVIQKQVNSTVSSLRFNLPGDSSGKYEFFWTVTGGIVTEIGIRWEGARINSIDCENVEIFASGKVPSLNIAFVHLTSIPGPSFPSTATGSFTRTVHDFPVNSTYIFLEFSNPLPIKSEPITSPAVSFTDIHSTQCPNNVRIYFPSSRLDLWTTESSLRKASNHFDVLLSPEFNEGKILTEIKNDLSTYKKEFEDSDDDEEVIEDTDDFVKTEVEEPVKSAAPFKQIKIDAIAHSTYRAFLHWLHTYEIIFAPVSSIFRLSEDPTAARRAAIEKPIEDPLLPRPVSPKSIYRLAHYYNIPRLQKLAFESIQSQLTVENIAFEVFSSLSYFPEIRDMEIAFCVENWDVVKNSKAMVEMERLADVGEDEPPYAMVLTKLARALTQVAAK